MGVNGCIQKSRTYRPTFPVFRKLPSMAALSLSSSPAFFKLGSQECHMTILPRGVACEHGIRIGSSEMMDRARERKKQYKKKTRKSQRSGRVERLKEAILQRKEEVRDLRCQSLALKTAVNKANITTKTLKK